VKAGARALGIAESYRSGTSTLAGAVVRADRVTDAVSFGTCTVGGLDATDAIVRLYERLDRDDVQYVLVAGIAPAWYNVVDLHALEAATARPVISVSFEDSEGLDDAVREAFDADAAARRLATYRAQPARRPVSVDDRRLFVRSVGIPAAAAADVVRGFTPEGGRPEPLRVAREAARAGERFRERLTDDGA
jgi:endonuclease V-like protein UPF0215 family